MLRFFEIFTILLAVVVAAYGKKEEIDYTQYGFNVETIKSVSEDSYNGVSYIHVEQIPTIQSVGIFGDNENVIYNGMLFFAQKVFWVEDNISLAIALISAIIIPLRKYVEE